MKLLRYRYVFRVKLDDGEIKHCVTRADSRTNAFHDVIELLHKENEKAVKIELFDVSLDKGFL